MTIQALLINKAVLAAIAPAFAEFQFSDPGDEVRSRAISAIALFSSFRSHCFTSKYTSVPGETFCPASGYCFTTVPVSAGTGCKLLLVPALPL